MSEEYALASCGSLTLRGIIDLRGRRRPRNSLLLAIQFAIKRVCSADMWRKHSPDEMGMSGRPPRTVLGFSEVDKYTRLCWSPKVTRGSAASIADDMGVIIIEERSTRTNVGGVK